MSIHIYIPKSPCGLLLASASLISGTTQTYEATLPPIIYTHRYIHTHTHTCKYIYMNQSICIYIYTEVALRPFLWMSGTMQTSKTTLPSVSIYICIHIYTRTHININLYAYIYIPKSPCGLRLASANLISGTTQTSEAILPSLLIATAMMHPAASRFTSSIPARGRAQGPSGQ